MSLDPRGAALAEIARLADQHHITAEELAALATESATPSPAAPSEPPAPAPLHARGVLVRVLGFLGGTFVFAGLSVFIGLQWDAMSSAARVVITLGSGVTAFALASLARRERRFQPAATPLYLIAAVLEPVGMLVAFEEYGSGGDWRWASLATSGAMAVQFGLAYVVARRSTVLLVAVSFAAVGLCTALDLVALDDGVIAIATGGSLVLAAVRADRLGHRDITPLWYFVGTAVCLAGVFDQVKSTPFEVVFIGAAAGFVYLSVLLRSRTLLVVSTLAILAYTGWFTSEHFADSIGWPLALVGFGLFMIALSGLAVRIDRDYVRASRVV
ncbi:MAG: DUF2157 domain-containing protein [Vicinamibacterales bacterium]